VTLVEQPSVISMAFGIITEVIIGLLCGILLGGLGYFFNKISNPYTRNYFKFFYCLLISILFPLVATYTHFTESKYIGCLFYGYVLYQVWDEDKPNQLLAKYWFYIQPFLFSTTGAALLFSEISSTFLFNSIFVIMVGLVFRIITAIVVTAIP